MARVVGPDFVALQLLDLEASARFYEERLGLERVPHGSPNAVVFRTEPVPFAVREPVADLDEVKRLGWGVALWMKRDEAQKLHDSLEEAGVRITRAIFEGAFGRTFAFADPGGYTLTMHDG